MNNHLMAGGKLSGNYPLFFIKVACTIIPSIFFKLGIFLKA